MSSADYSLDMSYWIDTDGYSDRDRLMFVCGSEFEKIYSVILKKDDWCQCIHTENESRVRLMCYKLGVPCKLKRVCDTWTHCEINASSTI